MQLRIKELREDRGWNQTVLGYHSELSPSQISLIETGKRNPSAETLQRIATALGVEVGDLFPKAQAPTSSLPAEERRLQGAARRSRSLPSNLLSEKELELWTEALQSSDTEWVIFGHIAPWLALLDREANQWEQAAAVGQVDRGYARAVHETSTSIFDSVTSLIDTLNREGLSEDWSWTSVLWQTFIRRLERLTKAHHEVESVLEKQLGTSELEQRRSARSDQVDAELKKITSRRGA